MDTCTVCACAYRSWKLNKGSKSVCTVQTGAADIKGSKPSILLISKDTFSWASYNDAASTSNGEDDA